MRRAKSCKPISCGSKRWGWSRESHQSRGRPVSLNFQKAHKNKGNTIDIEFFRNGRLRICHLRKRQAFLRGVIEVMKTVVTSFRGPFRGRRFQQIPGRWGISASSERPPHHERISGCRGVFGDFEDRHSASVCVISRA